MSSLLTYATLSAIKERKGNISSLLEVYQDLVETAIKNHFNTVATRGRIEELQETVLAD